MAVGAALISAEHLAQQRCQSEVLKRLVSPDKARLSDLHTETSTLDCRAYFVDGALAHTLVVFDHAH